MLVLAVEKEEDGALESREVDVVVVERGGREDVDVGDRSSEELLEAKVKLEPKLFSMLGVG